MSHVSTPKAQAQDALQRLPKTASWDDITYALYVRRKIEAGLADIAAGRTYSHEEVVARLRAQTRRASE